MRGSKGGGRRGSLIGWKGSIGAGIRGSLPVLAGSKGSLGIARMRIEETYTIRDEQNG